MSEVIKRFVNQKCLGYSGDFIRSYYEHVIELEDGRIITRWSITTTMSNKAYMESGLLDYKPYVAIPNPEIKP